MKLSSAYKNDHMYFLMVAAMFLKIAKINAFCFEETLSLKANRKKSLILAYVEWYKEAFHTSTFE